MRQLLSWPWRPLRWQPVAENLLLTSSPPKLSDVRDFGADRGWLSCSKGTTCRRLPIIIGHCEARALVGAMRDEDFPRPLAYDLLEAMLEKLQGEVMHLVVHSIKDNTFHANLYIETAAGEWVLDCRPSDGMVLVTRLGSTDLLATAAL